MQEHDTTHSLIKDVPGHLFSFEEKVFGIMTLTQLLCDLGAGVGILALTASFALVTRILVGVLFAFPILILVHGKVQDYTFLHWLYLYCRHLMIPRQTTWQSLGDVQSTPKGHVPSVQTSWIQFDSLTRGIAGCSEASGKNKGAGRYWVVFEVEGRNIRYLPEAEQVRVFGRFEAFLTGLEFRLQFISHTEQVHPHEYPPLCVQREALHRLRETPRLAALQRLSLEYQQRQLQNCTITRHFVVVSISTGEEALRRSQSEQRGMLSAVLRLIFSPKTAQITHAEVLDQLRIRCSVVKKVFQQLDIHAWLLNDTEQLRLFAACVAPGIAVPSFLAQTLDGLPGAALALGGVVEEGKTSARGEGVRRHASNTIAPATSATRHEKKSVRTPAPKRLRQKCIQGLHAPLYYQSRNERDRFEAGVLNIADLVAPSRIDVHPDLLEIEVGGKKRYQRYFTVVGYGHELLSGWVGDLTELGIPMLVSTQFEPLDTRFMIHKLEMHQVKLESKRFSDQKSLRLTTADQNIESEQVRRITRELAARRMKIFVVTMTIGIHAGSRERLDQRSQYLLSHLRQKQLRVRTSTRQHDQAWQSSLPTCSPLHFDQAVNLPSDACSTFLHASSGVIGTPRGVFLGFTGSGFSRRPVYFNPWSDEKNVPNPHVVVVGETGMGKSWLGKTFVSGLMGMGIADVVVLDRDDDYLPLHEALGRESQRYNLARSCPINFFELPFGPADVDPDDPADLLAEFLDNHLMLALALIVTDTENGNNAKLSKIEEAYLTQVGRAAYAAKGITSEAIRHEPKTLLLAAPTLKDFIAMMKEMPASSQEMRISLIERLEKALYLFPGETCISITKPLTIFSIHDLDEKWYPLMTFVVQNFLYRHRALRRDERYLAYIVEEASYMLKHPAGRRYLESGSRGFRKLGIAQFTLSQHPRDFLEEGAVILSNAGTAFFLGMQPNAAQKLNLSPELERVLTDAVPGQAVMRCGNEYAAINVSSNPKLRTIFTTDPRERKKIREREQRQHTTREAELVLSGSQR